MILQRPVVSRIRHPRRRKTRAPQPAGVAAPAGASRLIRLVAGNRLPVIDAEPGALADDLGLGQRDERRLDPALVSLDSRPGRKPGETRERGDELRTAVGI